MKFSRAAKNIGFTLIEVIVTIFIIAVISGLIFANYHQSGQHIALQNSANILSQDLRRAQQMAMSVKDYSCSSGKLKGFGIWLSPGADVYSLRARCEISDGVYLDPDPVLENHDELKKNGVIISNLIPNQDPLKIFFYPPDPVIDIGGATDAMITLSLKNASMTKTVKINEIGLIEIQ